MAVAAHSRGGVHTGVSTLIARVSSEMNDFLPAFYRTAGLGIPGKRLNAR